MNTSEKRQQFLDGVVYAYRRMLAWGRADAMPSSFVLAKIYTDLADAETELERLQKDDA